MSGVKAIESGQPDPSVYDRAMPLDHPNRAQRDAYDALWNQDRRDQAKKNQLLRPIPVVKPRR